MSCLADFAFNLNFTSFRYFVVQSIPGLCHPTRTVLVMLYPVPGLIGCRVGACNPDGVPDSRLEVLDYPPHFVKLDRGEKLPAGVRWAIGAGPNLVSRNPGGTSVIDIEGDNVNIVEHASNTAIALKGSVMMLVTFDGEDGCTEYVKMWH